ICYSIVSAITKKYKSYPRISNAKNGSSSATKSFAYLPISLPLNPLSNYINATAFDIKRQNTGKKMFFDNFTFC
ncbi:MAG: hypothetical protein QNJ68_23590, partial [Microcoleaceae cyanobacterium MO_207.B10]|nr:hypothetical protein [Microcoleaceae cyanobacterium MO_207.B10]